MATDSTDSIDEAIAWHVRLAAGDDDAWADFIVWLEASAANRRAYDAIASDDRLIAQARFPEPATTPAASITADNDNVPRPARWGWAMGSAAVAAALAVAVLGPSLIRPSASPYDVATGAGERRTVALGDGTSIEMSGGTTLKLDRNDPRVAMLDRGEAVFHVRHDAAHPFTITAGGVAIRDLGTVFNVERSDDRIAVGVAEGAVMFQPSGAAMSLGAGDMVTSRLDGSSPVRTRVAPDTVGGWRRGMVSFDNRRVGDVAIALRRLYGVNLKLDSSLSGRPFTGMVRFTGAADRDVPHLAGLIGAHWRRDGESWILSEGATATR